MGTTPQGYYRPLPNNLELRDSDIHGHGVFALEYIERGHNFGVTHIEDGRFQNNSIRLPLGAFINYSDIPNCKFVKDGELTFLVTIEDIEQDEELTVKYLNYNPMESGTNYLVPAQSLDR